MNVFPDLKLVSNVESKENSELKVKEQKTDYEKAYELMQKQLKAEQFRVVNEKPQLKVVKSEVRNEVSAEQLEAEFADLGMLGLSYGIFDKNTNNLATQFVVNNIQKLYAFARTLQIDKSKAEDLVHDVFKSLVIAERNGDCYQFSGAKATMITVEEFVKGRIKGYSKNRAYYVSEVSNVGNGNTVITCAATPEETGDSDSANNNSFRNTLKNASYEFNDYDTIEGSESLREQLLFIESMDELHRFGIIKMLKNIDVFDSFLSGVKSHKYESIFNTIRQAVVTHNELGEALQSVLEFAKDDRVRFESVLATI